MYKYETFISIVLLLYTFILTIKSVCVDATNNCVTCNFDYSSCSICDGGYSLVAPDCVLCSVSSCQYCSSTNTCSNCNPGFTQVSGACVACSDTNCQACNDTQLCFTCVTGFTQIAGACVACSDTNCQACNDTQICFTCVAGYTQVSGACISCAVSNCQACNDTDLCFTCEPGNTQISGACVSCSVSDCQYCDSADNCLTCNPTFVQLNGDCVSCSVNYCQFCLTTDTCSTCLQGYTLSSGTCYSCSPTNCQLCQSDDVCSRCGQSYTLYSGSCVSCNQAHCQLCQATDVCYRCVSGYTVSSGACFSCSPANCQLCQADDVCSQCVSTYTLYSGSCYSCTVSNCQLCQTNNVCSICLSGYTLYNSACRSCNVANCQLCQTTDTCTTCVQSYTLYSGSCVSCSPANCQLCQTADTCFSCVSGYTVDSGSCFQCNSDANCQLCKATNVCSVCNSGYMLNGGSCIQCGVSNCQICSSTNTCTSCVEGYTLYSGACKVCSDSYCQLCTADNTCASCVNLYTIYSGSCVSCNVANCQLCQIADTCFSCVSGYTVYSGTCNQCSSDVNCQLCQSNNVCAACIVGYTLSGGSCVSCNVNNCQLCNSADICAICVVGYTVSSGDCYSCSGSNCQLCTADNTCSKCVVGYTISSGSCISCNVAHCQLCQSADTCTNCVSGYTQYGGSCYLCGINDCQICQATSTCSVCQSGFTLYNNNCLSCSVAHCDQCQSASTCSTCQSGYTLDSNTCIGCNIPNCQLCKVTDTCDTCVSTFILYSNMCVPCNLAHCTQCKTPNVCSACDNLYTVHNGACVSCSDVNCVLCKTTDTCFTCAENYTVYNGACVSCNVQSCKQCQASDVCSTCITGYTLQNNQCFSCGLAKCQLCLTCLATGTNCNGCSSSVIQYLYNSSCYTTCPTGMYGDKSSCECSNCTAGCAECTDSGLTKCASCTNDSTTVYYKVYGRSECTTDCGNFYFGNQGTNECQPCHQSCITCQNQTNNCTSCRNITGIVYFYDNYTCVVACPQGYYGKKSDNNCEICNDECAACYGPNLDQCTKCKTNDTNIIYYKKWNLDTCSDVCDDGTYADSTTFSCKICNSQCKTCDTISTNCTSCGRVNGIDLFLYNNTCIYTCVNGTYREQSTDTCEACAEGCLLCYGSTLQDCTKCNTTYNGSITYYKYIGEDTCSLTCPPGQYIKSGVSFYCQACSPLCNACQVLSDNCTATDGCPNGNYFNNATNSCIASCPYGLYADMTTKFCEDCQVGCEACYGSTLNKCTKCTVDPLNATNNFFKHPRKDICTQNCPDGYYQQLDGYLCQPCLPSCSTCGDNATDCPGCKNQSGVVYFLLNNSCLIICPDGYYGQISSNQCQICNQTCAKCTGTTSSKCQACKQVNNTKYYLEFGATNCLDDCPDGQYEDYNNLICKVCDSNCKTCNSTASNCLSCYMEAGAFVFLSGTICVQNCPVGQYEQTSNYTCVACADGCKTCTGPTLDQCQSCKDTNGSVPYYKYANSTKCNESCPNGQFISSNLDHQCEYCSPSCITCVGLAFNCTSDGGCRNGKFFNNDTYECVSTCPNGLYGSTSTGFCEKCIGGCLLCFGSNLTECTKCGVNVDNSSQTYYKKALITQCTMNCPTGWYEQPLDYTCEKCHQSCASCQSNATDCPACTNVTGIVYYNFNSSQCLARCPIIGYFGRDYDNTCVVCHDFCNKCFDSDEFSCTACRQNNSIDYHLQYGTNTCVQDCPDGQYANSTAFLCLPCDSGCATCYENAKNCTSCYLVNGYYVYLYLNVCIQICPDGRYRDTTTKKCELCAEGCATCTGSSLSQCQSCDNYTSISLNETYYKAINASTCSSVCPRGQFISSSILYQCQACAPQCQACENASDLCISIDGCNRGFYFYNDTNSCIASCPNGYYADIFTGFCQSCAAGCLTCFGSALSQCYSCGADPNNASNTHYKMISLTTCTLDCNAGEYQETLGGYYCVKCHQSCALCDLSYLNCSQCKNFTGIVYYLLNESCLQICPSGYYGSMGSNQCLVCNQTCATCFGSTSLECYTCKKNNLTDYFLSYGTTQCLQTCIDGQYSNTTSHKCLVCDSNCKTCNSTASNCLSCYMEAGAFVFLSGTICVQNCPVGQYEQTSNYTCVACADGCKTCTGPTLDECQSCKDTNGSVPYYKYANTTKCNESCPNGQFISSNLDHQCEYCSPSCITCVGLAFNCTSDGGCRNGKFFNNDTYECVSTCPDGLYGSTSTGFCQKCIGGCLLCFGSTLSDCTKCGVNVDNSSETYYKNSLITQCTMDCPTGYYEQPLGYTCQICHQSCASCQSNATDCPACANVTGIVYYNLNSTYCLARCPTLRYFGRDLDNTCVVCHDFCNKCFDSDEFSCTACRQNNSIDYHLQYGTNTCVQDCPDGQYANSTAFLCLPCDSGCATCYENAKNCTSCYLVNGYYVYLYLNVCIQICPDGRYRDTTTKKCELCAEGCATCTGSSLSQCQSCDNYTSISLNQTYYKAINASTCSSVCPRGQFISSSILYQCQACAPQCQACENTSEQCILTDGCNRGFYFYNDTNSCIASCPNGYYADLFTGFCQFCPTGCLTCFGSAYTQCYTCGPDPNNASNTHYKMISLTTCTLDCNAGEYEETLGGYYCAKCHQSCALCDIGPLNCSQCKNFTGIVYYLLNQSCLQICPPGYYGDPMANECKVCDNACALCTQNTTLYCLSCKTYNSTNYFLSYGTTQCLEVCLPGQYANITSHKCLVCDSNCKTCNALSTNCTTCYLNNGQYVFWENYVCVQKCSDGWYGQFSNYTCTACADGCATCTGPLSTNCDACTIYNSTIYYKDRNSRTCNQTCPTGQFIDASIPYVCQACDVQCVHCSVTSNNCTYSYACTLGYYYYLPSNSCLLVCPNNYWADRLSTRQCIKCQDGCSLCYGAGYSACTSCQISTNSTPFYKVRFLDKCVSDCPDGDYQILPNLSCAPCADSCVLCQGNALACQQCKNASGIVYYYYANECMVACPTGLWGYKANNTCEICQPQCPSCFDNYTDTCYTCTLYNGTGYFLQYGTTICSTQCPYGQYKNFTQYKCRLCNINCATCNNTSTYCLTCTYINTINIVYLHNNKCVIVCPTNFWPNSTASLDHQCSPCHTYCVSCTGPSNYECSLCSNVTNGSVQTMYYKDLYSTTCDEVCPGGQFISTLIPNFCVPCNSKCALCSINATYCSKCQFAYYLYVLGSQCTSQCPTGYYNDPVLTANNYYCTICQLGCYSCTGPTLNSCQSCTNATIPPNTTATIFYKHQQVNSCVQVCSVGYFGQNFSNKCQPCQGGCVTCSGTANYCFSCTTYNYNDYYKVVGRNQCVTICPDGTYGDSRTYSCIVCPYFTYQGLCLLSCPNQTNVDTTTGRVICQTCSTSDNTCQQQYVFELKTTVSDDGQSLIHNVYLPEGLSSQVTQETLSGAVVYLVYRSARRLMNTMTPLTIKSLKIERPKNIIITTSNMENIDFSRSFIQVNFPGGSIIAENGIPYSSTTDVFYLDDAQFVGTYYRVFSDKIEPKIMGITYTVFAIVLVIIILSIPQKKTYHEQMTFIMFLQCIGLLRMRSYPIQSNVYTVLIGFSQMQILFIPNAFFNLFPTSYVEISYDSMKFAWGTQNFIQHMGSIFLIYIPLQIILFIYYAAKNRDAGHKSRYKLLQQFLIQLFLPIIFFNITVSFISLSKNNILSSIEYMISQLVAVLIFFGYLGYLIAFVRKHVIYQLYKLNNVMRAIMLAIMCVNTYGGLIPMIILELVFVIIDARLYRQIKIDKKTYFIDRALMIVAITCGCLINSYVPMLGILGACILVLFTIKAYYIILRILDAIEQRRKRQLSDISVSDVADKSVKQPSQKAEYEKKADVGSDIFNQSAYKLNQNTMLYNQTIDVIDRRDRKPIKINKKIIYNIESEEDEQQKSQNHKNIDVNSQQSIDELVVYLDPQDYQGQNKATQKQQSIPQKKRDSSNQVMQVRDRFARTTAGGFYKRKNDTIKSNDSIQIIKVDGNSQIDRSDLVSEKSDGEGWLKENDQKNEERRRNNKLVWKVIDLDQQKKSLDKK